MQTQVLDAPLIASPGDIADHATAKDGDIVTATNQEAAANAYFGTMVKRGTAERTMKNLAATADKASGHGIVTRGHHYSDPLETGLDANSLGYLKPGVAAGVGRTKRYAVLIEEDVDVGDPVRVRCVAGVGEIAGAFRATEDGTDCLLLPGDAFYWVKGGAIDPDTGFGVAILHVDMNHIDRAVADDGV